jgi:hypothetical protein
VLLGVFAPSRADARLAETRTWVFAPEVAETRLKTEPQAVGTHQENGLWNYEHAPGCTQAAESAAVAKNGSFSVIGWKGYPANVPKPTGPMTLLEGAEYTAARRAADATNNTLREGFGLRGVKMDIHEIQPVKFGGSPIDPTNKLLLPQGLHRQQVTPFWNQLQRDIEPFLYRSP